MRGHAYAKSVAEAAVAAGLLGVALPAAQADEVAFCVSCQGPDQTYVCRVTGDDLRKSDALKLYCVVRTAKEGGHASCGARNDISSCNGVEKVYAYNGPALPDAIADDPRVKGFAEKIARGQKASEQYEEHKGKSLAAVTGRAFSASRRGIRNMVGGNAQPNQSPLPAASPPMDPLPERQASAAPALPLSATPAPMRPAAAPLPDAASDPSPARPGRLRRGAQNVGSFARSSYRCVRSLFRKCRSEPEALPAPN
jgi:hypothetical protein